MSTGKQNLFTFGCSFTYGHGFPDCIEGNEGPSKHAWPYLLGKSLGVNHENLSQPGGSAQEILRIFLTHSNYFSPGDIVTIVWPFFDRFLVTFGPEMHQCWKLTPNGTDFTNHMTGAEVPVEEFYRYFSTDALHYELFLHASKMVHDICIKRGIHLVNYIFDNRDYKFHYNTINHQNYHWYDVKIERGYFDVHERLWGRYNKISKEPLERLPCFHHGYGVHKIWAERVKRAITRKGYLNGL